MLLCVCVFVFKQKTAYEMRISDWSSDVCSSDLRALALADARGVPALVLTFEPHPRTIFQPDRPVYRLTPAPLKARLLEAMGFRSVIEYPFDPELGSASCRERVCQYV